MYCSTPADAAELLAAAGAAPAALHQCRQWGYVTGGLVGAVAVQNKDPAVVGSGVHVDA
jgi:hypothetical protein